MDALKSEHVVALAAVLKDCQTRATQLLAKAAKAKVKVPAPATASTTTATAGAATGEEDRHKGERRDLARPTRKPC